MSLIWPDKIQKIIIGLDDELNFMNFEVYNKPTTLILPINEPTTVEFSFTAKLIEKGWSFQDPPFKVNGDYGVNFSSHTWGGTDVGPVLSKNSFFRVVFMCQRLGEYEYSIFMQDGNGQRITLDPKIENGAGINNGPGD